MALSKLPMRKALVEHRKRIVTDGMIFPLDATSMANGEDEAWEVRVRRISTMDEAIIEALPADAQQAVFDGLKALQKAQEEAGNNADAKTMLEMLGNNRQALRAADELFCAALIEPECVMTEADLVGNPDAYVVTDFAAEDRMALMMAMVNTESGAGRKLKLFRPSEVIDVPARETGGLDESAALRTGGDE